MITTCRVWASWMLVLPFLPVPFLLGGCKGFWDPISSTSDFTLSNSGAISVASPGDTSGNTSTITVTPSTSFTGTVALSCAVTTSPSNASSPVTCSLSPTSVSISSTTAQTATLTATTTSTTTTGSYQITVTGTSGSVSTTTTACVTVGTSSGNCSSASTSGNFYILTNKSISGYSINAGAVTALSNSSFTNLNQTTAVAIGPSGNFLYVAATGGIFLYTINTSTGALSQGSVSFSDSVPEALQVDPSGKWLLDASATGTLYAFPITSSGTEDTSRSAQNLALAGTPAQGGLAISPNGALIAVALGSSGTEAFPFTAGNTSPIGNAYSPITSPMEAAALLLQSPSIPRAGSCMSARPRPFPARPPTLARFVSLPSARTHSPSFLTRLRMLPPARDRTPFCPSRQAVMSMWPVGKAGRRA